MLELMGFMDAPSLGRLASVSRALYVFAHVEELWKSLVVQVFCAWLFTSARQFLAYFFIVPSDN